ncbi:DEAD/DEAH box helicase family protein [Shewanella intestini]|uniref:DEAD/DEAH box helicase n=1 Tax=Shewanella intestini TaxID=2017544 RepID=A0ABS5HYZ7_9GAMM|nr:MULTISPECIES: DEAD/DEAH box helicase [Shewanella]MBR9726994.1 DEAD/DEAH box helicase [Shewanella intestini]MRG35795.1 DEAD/DEAH box helicase [Shewanella sp. XMDDZSB0408]
MPTSTKLTLRDYQQQSVDAAIQHFKGSQDSAVIVLPTGAGKSIVIAELARIAKGNILILTHVKELVEQNAQKVELLTDKASIYSAGLKQKQATGKTVVASIQSSAKAVEKFNQPFSLVIIDECHRVSNDKDSQYQSLLTHLRHANPAIRLLGLTATPYRLGIGWIYRFHYHGKIGNTEKPTFEKCIFELPMRPLIKKGFLTQPKIFDGLSAQYDFSALSPSNSGEYPEQQLNSLLNQQGRATTAITQQIISLAQARKGVIIFAATVRHAQEIMTLLDDTAALITAKTPHDERDDIIIRFKDQTLKYIVNVAVLTTGFDAPHVDFIAILRPTASISLFQQMVGRGLRLFKDKSHCLVIDYAANGYDLYFPEVGHAKPNSRSVPVQVHCPVCQFANTFWGIVDNDGDIVEHFGRRCQGTIQAEQSPPNKSADLTVKQCDFRFRSKQCPDCGAENDIAARVCQSCQSTLIDPDKRLKEVLQSKHHHLFKCQQMVLSQLEEQLQVQYLDIEGNDYTHKYRFETQAQQRAFFATFVIPHTKTPGLLHPQYRSVKDVLQDTSRFRKPDLLLLKKNNHRWDVVESYFDYQGQYKTSFS